MNTIQIHNQELQIKQWDRQRVVTFKDIDRVHERPDGTAHRNFKTNRRHFIEGEDYHKVSSDEIRLMGIETSGNLPNGIYLITESGYLMLVKSFTDDLAWKVQRQLVNCYFRVKEEVQMTVTQTEGLTKAEWIKISEIISSCSKHAYPALLIALNKLAPGQFEKVVVEPETTLKFQLSDDFGKQLSDALSKNHLTQKQLAEKVGAPKSAISQYVNGKHKPHTNRYQKICEVLNITLG